CSLAFDHQVVSGRDRLRSRATVLAAIPDCDGEQRRVVGGGKLDRYAVAEHEARMHSVIARCVVRYEAHEDECGDSPCERRR
ncbi:MAG: hypothetical protein ACI90M_004812, partial [Candidatus Azotimanducaceae bacterium]